MGWKGTQLDHTESTMQSNGNNNGYSVHASPLNLNLKNGSVLLKEKTLLPAQKSFPAYPSSVPQGKAQKSSVNRSPLHFASMRITPHSDSPASPDSCLGPQALNSPYSPAGSESSSCIFSNLLPSSSSSSSSSGSASSSCSETGSSVAGDFSPSHGSNSSRASITRRRTCLDSKFDAAVSSEKKNHIVTGARIDATRPQNDISGLFLHRKGKAEAQPNRYARNNGSAVGVLSLTSTELAGPLSACASPKKPPYISDEEEESGGQCSDSDITYESAQSTLIHNGEISTPHESVDADNQMQYYRGCLSQENKPCQSMEVELPKVRLSPKTYSTSSEDSVQRLHEREKSLSFQLPEDSSSPLKQESLPESSNAARHGFKRTSVHANTESGHARRALLSNGALNVIRSHSPLSSPSRSSPKLTEARFNHGQSVEPTLPPAAVLLSPKAQHWDWRSKSLGAKASLKSAVRNLEAAFSGSRSISLPKTRSKTPKQEGPSQGSPRMIERVFGSPLRSRGKQMSCLATSSANKSDSGRSIKRDHARFPSVSMSSNLMMACAPSRPVVNHLSSYIDAGNKHRKTSLDASSRHTLRSVHCFPASKVAVSETSSASPGHRLSRASNKSVTISMRQAYVQYIVKDDVPLYVMSIVGSEEMLLAKSCAQENEVSAESGNVVFSFHSAKNKSRGTGGIGWKNWMRKDSKSPCSVTGIMRVSSTVKPEVVKSTGEVKHIRVSEYILYDGRESAVEQCQSLRLTSPDSSVQRTTTVDSSGLDSPSFVNKDAPNSDAHLKQASRNELMPHVAEKSIFNQISSPHKGSGSHRSSCSVDTWTAAADPLETRLQLTSSTSIELAAMVIQMPVQKYPAFHKLTPKGCGLKFLNDDECDSDAARVARTLSLSAVYMDSMVKYGAIAAGKALRNDVRSGYCSSPESYLKRHNVMRYGNHSPDHSASTISQDSCRPLTSWKPLDKVTLILPMGHHGSPCSSEGGPSTLIERWRSGGSCDCGGWDVGCGIRVSSTEKSWPQKGLTFDRNNAVSTQDKCLNIFSQGIRQDLMLRLSVIKDSLFRLEFQGQISSLGAFATAVAVLYNQQVSPESISSASSSSSPISPLREQRKHAY